MKLKNFIYGSTLLLIMNGCSNKLSNSMAKFKGIWKLDKYESFDSTMGKWYETPNRIGYTGYILYDGLGHVAVQLIPPAFNGFDNSKSVDSLNDDEIKRILKLQFTSFAYVANYNISEKGNSIEHHRLSSNNPKEWGTTVKRNFEFRGDTLLLTAKELIGNLKTRLRWVKL